MSASPEELGMTTKWMRKPVCLSVQLWGGRQFYGGARGRGQVIFLPRNCVAKLDSFPTEAAATEYVRQHTTIPVPKISKVYSAADGQQHIVMERLPGTCATDTVAGWSQDQKEPPSPQFIGSVGTASKGQLIDDRLSVNPCSPFDTIADFHTYLRFGRPLDHWFDMSDVTKVHTQPENYMPKFAHSDLYPKNILVSPDGHITGIIDWEYAGWYPDYWEYTKMHHLEFIVSHWKNFYDAIEKQAAIQKYPDELACERVIWARMGSLFRYCDPPWQPGDDEKAAAERARMDAIWEEQHKERSDKEKVLVSSQI
ncbi:hypothetical protein DV736_g2651, partial [Chaetothyriales sp. CBS 134916]